MEKQQGHTGQWNGSGQRLEEGDSGTRMQADVHSRKRTRRKVHAGRMARNKTGKTKVMTRRAFYNSLSIQCLVRRSVQYMFLNNSHCDSNHMKSKGRSV